VKIHVIKNAPHEGEGYIATWAEQRGHQVVTTPLYDDVPVPSADSFDWLVMMGGPMGVHESDTHPWLAREMKLVEEALAQRTIILGVCLGAQLIAHVLGARVYRNDYIERGWHTISRIPEAGNAHSFQGLPQSFTAFTWHTDAFELPRGAALCASSEACKNHAFEYDGRVVGLQFHLEVDPSSIADVIDRSGYMSANGPYIQTRDDIFRHIDNANALHPLMDTLLDNIEKNNSRST
jgi:GMP synthase-like glutamine amidotransferase